MCHLELTQLLLLTLIQPIISALCPWLKERWPEWFLPRSVILKRPKSDWESEYDTEKQAYKLLRPLQGTVIPYFYGEAVHDGSPALVFSTVAGSTLFYLALNEFPKCRDAALRKGLEDAFRALILYGVEYEDEKLDNFLWVDEDERVVIIDFEQVRFDAWEKNTNPATAASLMSDFMETRDPELGSNYRYPVGLEPPVE